MTPITATLTGALGIRAGLNRDSVTLDLSTLPADALTVAIRGDNGMGKSTILNLALVPWREPPVSGTIYDQFGPSGLRELIWTHGGQEYWTRIEYKNSGKTKTQKATLKIKQGDAWTPVTLPDHTTSDGKASTYDACLSHILGPQDLYYLAAFKAQGAKPLAEHADPKGLMRALLALDEPDALAEQAKEIARDLKRHHAAIRDQAAALDGHAARIIDLETAIRTLLDGHADRTAAKLAAIDAAGRAKAELERVLSGDLDRQRVIEQRNALVNRLRDENDRVAATLAAADNALAAARRRRLEAERTGEAGIAALGTDLARAQSRVTAAETTLTQRDAIEQAEAELSHLQAQIEGQQETIEAQRHRLDGLRALAAKVQTLEAQQAHAAADGKALQSRLVELTTRADFVAVVPCRGEGEFATCPALAEALAAAGQVDAAKTAVEARRNDWRRINADLKAMWAQTADMAQHHDHLLATQALLAELTAKLDGVRQTAAFRSALDQAEQHLAEATVAVADLIERLYRARADLGAQLLALAAEIDGAEAAAQQTRAAGDAVIAALRAELAMIPDPGTDQALDLARQQVATAEAAVQAASAALDQAGAAKAQRAAEIARLQRELDQGAAIRDQARAFESEIADWTLLALGLRGVIDLSIEDAGPGIAALANQLLTDAYGPRFSVRIVTQREQQNGVVRECFDISVIDAESGLESSLLQKSGGEMVWLDKALTDAVGIYHQDAAGQNYECLFSDEAEDGLTQERKAQFYRMDRAALELGGYRRKFFISHNPDAWASADHVIDLSDYREAA